jgi:hypothetical protein
VAPIGKPKRRIRVEPLREPAPVPKEAPERRVAPSRREKVPAP